MKNRPGGMTAVLRSISSVIKHFQLKLISQNLLVLFRFLYLTTFLKSKHFFPIFVVKLLIYLPGLISFSSLPSVVHAKHRLRASSHRTRLISRSEMSFFYI